MSTAHTDRNWTIYWQRCAGASYAALGHRHGITSKRARDCYLLVKRIRERERVAQEMKWLTAHGVARDIAAKHAHELDNVPGRVMRWLAARATG